MKFSNALEIQIHHLKREREKESPATATSDMAKKKTPTHPEEAHNMKERKGNEVQKRSCTKSPKKRHDNMSGNKTPVQEKDTR